MKYLRAISILSAAAAAIAMAAPQEIQQGIMPDSASVALTNAGQGQTQAIQAAVADSARTEPAAETLAVPPMTKPAGTDKELISVAVDDVSIQEVVKMFTRVSGANIIATPTNLQGKVTVNLQDVEWKPALSSILDMYNLTITEKSPGSGIFSVMPKPPGATEPLVAATIVLNYAPVSNVVALVQPLLGKEGTIAPFPNGNALVIRSTAVTVNEVRKIIEEIDKPRNQVYIEAKILELSEDAIKDLGINWQILQGYSIGVGGMQWGLQENRDKTIGRDDRLTQTDNRRITDTTAESFDSTGAQYDQWTTRTDPQGNTYYEQVPTRAFNNTIDQSINVSRNLQNTFTKTVADIRTAVLSADDFQIVLSALKQMNGVNIVSNPKIIVANEQTAAIHIGQTEPNIKGTVTPGQQGQANTTTYSLDEKQPYFEYGISLDVTPTINNMSNIVVRIVPKLTRFRRNKTAPDNNTYPITDVKTVQTMFSLESGKTAAIGGLTETSDREVTSKIPLLGDIPLLGKYLFSHTHTERSQQETIIFVTVCMANPQSVEENQGVPAGSTLVHKRVAAEKLTKETRGGQEKAKDQAVSSKDKKETP